MLLRRALSGCLTASQRCHTSVKELCFAVISCAQLISDAIATRHLPVAMWRCTAASWYPHRESPP